MLILSQRDPKWSQTKIGKTNLKLSKIGCTTTCISMASSYFGEYKDPGILAQSLSYTGDGRILWPSIDKVFKTIKFYWRGYAITPITTVEIDYALKSKDKCIILNVDGGAHWVLGIRRIAGGLYWVADPWSGTRKLYSGVVGYAIIERK